MLNWRPETRAQSSERRKNLLEEKGLTSKLTREYENRKQTLYIEEKLGKETNQKKEKEVLPISEVEADFRARGSEKIKAKLN